MCRFSEDDVGSCIKLILARQPLAHALYPNILAEVVLCNTAW